MTKDQPTVAVEREEAEYTYPPSALSADTPPPAAVDAINESVPQAWNVSLLSKVLVCSAASLSNFIGSASFTAVVMTVPSIASDFQISNLQAQWVASAYGMAYGCALLVSGRLADIYGRRGLFVGGLAFYILCSVVSPFIRNLVALCVIRAFAGLGLALVSPSGFGIVAVTFPEEPGRTVAYSVLALGNPLGAMGGTLIGGGIASAGGHGWSYLFLILAGVSVIPVLIGVFVVKDSWWIRGPKPGVDWIGAVLVTTGTSLFAFSLTQSGIVFYGWKTPYIGGVFATSLAILGLFILHEYRLEHKPQSRLSRNVPPLVKLSLFTRQRGRIAAVAGATFMTFVCVPGWIYLTTVFYQDHQHLTPLQNAIRLIPSCVSGTLASLLVIYLLPRVNASYILSGGAFLSGLACLLFAIEPPNLSYWAVEFLAGILISFGADMGVGIGSVLIANLVKDDEQSVAGAVFQTSIQIASSFGICLSSLVANEQAKKSGELLQGLRDAFGMNVAWAWLVPVIVLTCLKGVGIASDVRQVDRRGE